MTSRDSSDPSSAFAEKTCNVCGVAWKPTSLNERDFKSRCRPCRNEYKRDLRSRPAKPPMCKTCGQPTGDPRASVKYCPTHSQIGLWATLHFETNRTTIQRIEPPSEEDLCLQIAKAKLSTVRAALQKPNPAAFLSQREESKRRGTSQE